MLVTHAVGADKESKLSALDLDAVEVDVGELRRAAEWTVDEIERFVLERAPRRWIQCTENATGRAVIEGALRETERLEGIDLARAYRNFADAARRLPFDPSDADRVAERGFVAALGEDCGPGTGFVWMHPTALRAHLVENFLLATELVSFHALDVVEFLEGERLLCQCFRRLTDGVASSMTEAGVTAGAAEAWAAGFLEAVSTVIPMQADDAGHWTLDLQIRAALAGEREFRSMMRSPVRGAPPSPLGRVRAMVRELSRLCGVGVGVRKWADTPYGATAQTPLELCVSGDARFREVESAVGALLASARLGAAPGNDAGLPLNAELRRRAEVIGERLRSLLGNRIDAERNALALAVLTHPAVAVHGVEWASSMAGSAHAATWLAEATVSVEAASKAQQDLSVWYWAVRAGTPPAARHAKALDGESRSPPRVDAAGDVGKAAVGSGRPRRLRPVSLA